MNKQENSTLSTNSKKKEEGVWSSLKRFVCPCLLPPSPEKGRFSKESESEEPMEPQNSIRSSQRSQKKKNKSTAPSTDIKDKKHSKLAAAILEMQLKKQPLLDKAILLNQEFSENGHTPSRPHRRSLGNSRVDYPICSLCDRQLISVGINDRHLLVKVANIHLSPNPAALKRQLAQTKPYYNRIKQTQTANNIDKYWAQRYALFERFDQGIRLDDPSWVRTPPGPVCQWIAGKCSQATLILDAFAGVGGTSIRIASSPRCMKIIANDWNGRRLQCLLNNAKVYDVDRCVELSECNFLQFQLKGIEVVFAQPPIDQEMRTTTTGCLSIVDFEPTLDKVISKAMSLAPNFILLLPPAISIDVLCSCINKCATELGKMKNSCSAKLQKIYYQGELKYILVTVGRMVQDQIKLNHELNFIYGKLQEPQKTPFHYKKLVKTLREQYGMIYLLNLVKQCEKKRKELKVKNDKLVFDIFVDAIKQKNLISSHKLNKLLTEHETSMQKSMQKKRSQLNLSNDRSEDSNRKNQTKDNIPIEAIMEEQKIDEEMPYFRMSEQTQSEESHYSYLSGLGHPTGSNRTPRVFAESFGSIIIKRTLNGSKEKRSVSPNSPGRGPMSPLRNPKVTVSPHRASQIVIGKERPQVNRTSQIVSKKGK